MSDYLRKAVKEDMDLLFAWANDPKVRKNSFFTAQISYEEHQKWFLELIRDASRKQYIYMVDKVPAGQIRVELDKERAEIGYSVCAEYRGCGYGKRMLALLPGQLKKDAPGVQILTAKVKEGNLASEGVFTKNGYRRIYTVFEFDLKEWEADR